MFRNTEYTALFRELATRHKEIRHREGQETHFVKVILSSDMVQKQVSLIDFYAKLKEKIKPGLTLLLISYAADYEDVGDEKVLSHRHGSFIILEKARVGDNEDRDRVLDHTEAVGFEIMAAFAQQFRGTQAKRDGRMFDRSHLATDSVGPVCDNHHGTRFDFMFTQPATKALTFDASKFDQ